MTTDKLTNDVLFDLNRAYEIVDTLYIALESATAEIEGGMDDSDDPTSVNYDDLAMRRLAEQKTATVKRLDADALYLSQASKAIREAERWLEAMRQNSTVMLRFQRYVDPKLTK